MRRRYIPLLLISVLIVFASCGRNRSVQPQGGGALSLNPTPELLPPQSAEPAAEEAISFAPPPSEAPSEVKSQYEELLRLIAQDNSQTAYVANAVNSQFLYYAAIDKAFGFSLSPNGFARNWSEVADEKWLLSGDTWYYIIPNGNIYEWESGTKLRGRFVVNVGPQAYAIPSLIADGYESYCFVFRLACAK